MTLKDSGKITLLEQTCEHLEQSLEMHRVMADILRISLDPLDLEDFLQRALDVLTSVQWFSVKPKSALFLANHQTGQLELKAQVGLPCALLGMCDTLPLGSCICARAAAGGDLAFMDHFDVRHDMHGDTWLYGHYRVPLVFDDVVLGVVTLFVKDGQPRVEEQQQFLESVADVLAGVIKCKTAEETLQKRQELFDLVIDGSNAGIWDWNISTGETYYSARWKNMLGYGEDEVTNHYSEWEERLHPDDKPSAISLIHRHLSGETSLYEFEHRLKHKDGSYRWILARGSALRDRRGQPYRMVGSHLDITERKEMEEHYRAREAQLISAKKIQEHIWPQRAPELAGYDIAAKVFPAEFAAGDHYDFFTLNDETMIFLVADVVGHGFSSALLMASTHAYIRSLFSTDLAIGEVMDHTNAELMRDTDLFVSMFLGCLRPREHAFVYVNAGHPTGYLLGSSGHVKRALPSSVPPLAIVDDVEYLPSEPIYFDLGDTLLLTTDGVSEARSPDDELFGTQRMLDSVRDDLHLPAEQMIRGLHQRVMEFCGTKGVEDDLTALVIKRTVDEVPFDGDHRRLSQTHPR